MASYRERTNEGLYMNGPARPPVAYECTCKHNETQSKMTGQGCSMTWVRVDGAASPWRSTGSAVRDWGPDPRTGPGGARPASSCSVRNPRVGKVMGPRHRPRATRVQGPESSPGRANTWKHDVAMRRHPRPDGPGQ